MKRTVHSNKQVRRGFRHARVRSRLSGTAERPRLSVFRGNKSMTVQLINDATGSTIIYVASGRLKPVAVEGKTAKVAAAYLVGKALAEQAKAKGVTQAVFDRGGYRYHGRVAAVAEGAREGGLQF